MRAPGGKHPSLLPRRFPHVLVLLVLWSVRSSLDLGCDAQKLVPDEGALLLHSAFSQSTSDSKHESMRFVFLVRL
ncbi:hypothetical protein GW17_00038931 [Ensete ventricosum]|nr:hypothetical protein GW17_00038931 [Ensete ventricosum]